MPEDLRPRLGYLKEILDAMGISRLELEGYEADDVIGTTARLAEKAGYNVLIVTGDKDALQLVSDRTKVILTRRGISDTLVVDEEVLKKSSQSLPSQVRDLKGFDGR